jgi:outer membrane protein assembly factor BamD
MLSIDRDQTETVRAAKEFEKLLARFPDSKFSLMAEKMLRECRVRIAEHEFYVGEFYFKQKKYQAALKRFETINREYANLGLDYKVSAYIQETQKRIAQEKARKEARKPKKRNKFLNRESVTEKPERAGAQETISVLRFLIFNRIS